jgi:hypothetical protein
MIETTFMGIATALATSGWFNPILLGNNSLKQEKSQNYNYTHGNGRSMGFERTHKKLYICCYLISTINTS